MRGKKGVKHDDPDDPPRRRANNVKGHGTWKNDRPPVLGVFARASGEIHLEVTHSSSRAAIQPLVEACTSVGCTVNTDEWVAYDKLPERGRKRVKVKHSKPNCEYARDDDGDGIREVHCNSIEGVWTGLRNFLRTFRGVSKKYLAQYVAIFDWSHNIKIASTEFIRALLGTIKGT